MLTRLSRQVGVFVVLFAVLVLAACSKSGGASVTLYHTDAGRTIKLKRGDVLSIELEGNPSTGFTWQVASVEEGILKQEGDYEFEADQPGLPGSGGTCTFTFAAVGVGQTALEMIYHQPWDEETPPSKTFQIAVVVR